jgi:hypothetical protein
MRPLRVPVALDLELRAMNHAPAADQYWVRWNPPPGWRVARAGERLTAAAGGETSAREVIAPLGR